MRFCNCCLLLRRWDSRARNIDSVIKTRMQSLEARQAYRNSFHCAYRIFTEEGILRFWTGTTPRLARLVVRGLLLALKRI